MKMQNGYEKRNGIVIKSNNSNGYNKHKKNIVPKITEEIVTLEMVQEAYRDLWKAKREQLSKAQRYARLHKEFLGLDKINEEMKE